MITLFLGAGFSYIGGVPIARGLFDEEPEVDRITRERLVARVLEGWNAWFAEYHGAPEEYLAYLQDFGGPAWRDAVWYVGLVIALRMGRVELVGLNRTIARHNINRTTGIPAHEAFWSAVFRRTTSVTVLTTNYDILAERGIRHVPRKRIPRPGFHYGDGPEHLEGGGYPSYTHIQKIAISGHVPLLKLHGSVSWSYRNGRLIHYHDCRPAIRGDAALVAPVTEKRLPEFLRPTWDRAHEALTQAQKWIFVGYSLPEYDHLVVDLLRSCSGHHPEIHIFDPDPSVADRYTYLLGAQVSAHSGLPEAIGELEQALD